MFPNGHRLGRYILEQVSVQRLVATDKVRDGRRCVSVLVEAEDFVHRRLPEDAARLQHLGVHGPEPFGLLGGLGVGVLRVQYVVGCLLYTSPSPRDS